MEMDIYENITKNDTFDPDVNYVLPAYYYLQIPILITAFVSAISNILILTLVITYPILHTRVYYYIASWSVCNVIVCLSIPMTLNALGLNDEIPATLYCLWTETDLVFTLGEMIFIAIISLDWYILTFSGQSHCAGRWRRSHKLLLAIVWITVVLLATLSMVSCLVTFTIPISVLLLLLGYITLSTLIFVLLILRAIKLRISSVVVEKRNLEVKLVVSYFLCWLPNLLGIVYYFIELPGNYTQIEYWTYILGYSTGWIFLTILYYNDRNLKKCLLALFKMQKYQSEGYVKEGDDTFMIDS